MSAKVFFTIMIAMSSALMAMAMVSGVALWMLYSTICVFLSGTCYHGFVGREEGGPKEPKRPKGLV